jgi:hypothetical protein
MELAHDLPLPAPLNGLQFYQQVPNLKEPASLCCLPLIWLVVVTPQISSEFFPILTAIYLAPRSHIFSILLHLGHCTSLVQC